MIPNVKNKTWLFMLWNFQGLICILWLILLPTNTEKGVFFGFSASRIGMLAFLIFLFILPLLLIWLDKTQRLVTPEILIYPLYYFSI
ncbi:MAG: hypothetical protein WCP19_10165, partial [Chloroflexota bacterium]